MAPLMHIYSAGLVRQCGSARHTCQQSPLYIWCWLEGSGKALRGFGLWGLGLWEVPLASGQRWKAQILTTISTDYTVAVAGRSGVQHRQGLLDVGLTPAARRALPRCRGDL